MLAEARRRVSMAARALDFSLAHPDPDTGYTAVVGTLQDRVTRAKALEVQESDGRTGEHGAIRQRQALREEILEQLRHLFRVAEMASATDPSLVGMFHVPAAASPHRVVIAAAQAMLATATAHKDLLVSCALGMSFIDNLTQALAQFDAVTSNAHAGRSDHVGAYADLLALGSECVAVVGVLDGFNRARFKNDPELFAAWQSASNVAGPFRSHAQVDPPPAPAPAPAPAPSDGSGGGSAERVG